MAFRPHEEMIEMVLKMTECNCEKCILEKKAWIIAREAREQWYDARNIANMVSNLNDCPNRGTD